MPRFIHYVSILVSLGGLTLLLAEHTQEVQKKIFVFTFKEYNACQQWDKVQKTNPEDACNASAQKCYGRRLLLSLSGDCHLSSMETWTDALLGKESVVSSEEDLMLLASDIQGQLLLGGNQMIINSQMMGTNNVSVYNVENAASAGNESWLMNPHFKRMQMIREMRACHMLTLHN
jgi:hypothetical protein